MIEDKFGAYEDGIAVRLIKSFGHVASLAPLGPGSLGTICGLAYIASNGLPAYHVAFDVLDRRVIMNHCWLDLLSPLEQLAEAANE